MVVSIMLIVLSDAPKPNGHPVLQRVSQEYIGIAMNLVEALAIYPARNASGWLLAKVTVALLMNRLPGSPVSRIANRIDWLLVRTG
jgi:hypothetical protein